MSSQKAKQSGFTLVEIASVMAVSGVLAVTGLPMINDYKARSAAASVQNNFAEALGQARTYAVSQGKLVKVCGSHDGKVCSNDAWSKGWLVHQGDSQSSNIAEQDIISAYQFEQAQYTLQVFDESWNSVNEIRFDTQGFNLAQQRLAATVCLPGANSEIDAVLIERTGRVRTSTSAGDRRTAAAVLGSASSGTFSQCNEA